MMKNQLTLIWGLSLLCLASSAMAQENEEQHTSNATYVQQFDEQFQIQAEQVANGYLYDRVYPTADLKNLRPCDTVESQTILQAWWEMENSNLNSNVSPWYNDLRTQLRNSTLGENLPVVAIDYQASTIDSLAYNDGRLVYENYQYRVAENQNPFHSFQSQLVGLAQNEVLADKVYKIYIDPKYFVSNTGSLPSTVIFTNHQSNETFTIPLGATAEVMFSDPGKVICSMEILLIDGSSFCNKFMLEVSLPFPTNSEQCQDGFMILVESDIPFQGITEDIATTSIADAHVFFHRTPESPCRIIRPAIIVDGFDPLDKRSFNKLFEDVQYTKNGNFENLISDMQDAGYDVIVLNFPVLGSQVIGGKDQVKAFKNGQFDGLVNLPGRDGGADYIQRNAFLTVKLIQMVNAMLKDNGSNEDLVVIGPSMGGLITRYALAYMEKHDAKGVANMKHNTRLWLSFDAPHNGANIPMSTQVMVDYFANYMGDQTTADMFSTRLRSIAARQLLIDSYEALWSDTKFYSQKHYTEFYKDLEQNGLSGSNGWPQNVRKVSVLNGNLKGIETFVSGTEDIKIVRERKSETVFKVDMRYGPKTGDARMIFEGLFAEERSKNDAQTKPVLKDQNGLFGNQSIESTTFIRTHSTKVWFNNSNPKGALDVVPGGLYPPVKEISDVIINKSKPKEGSKDKFYQVATGSDFTFIPSMSAMGLKNPNIPWNTSFGDQNLVCKNLTYFDNYYAPEKDEYHTQVTANNAKFILQEVLRGQKNCDKICVEADEWPEVICKGSTEELKLKSLPVNTKYTVIWGMDDAFDVISGQNTAKAKLKAMKTNTTNPVYNVSAIISSACAADYFVKGKIEIPNTMADIKGLENFCIFGETFEAHTTTKAVNPKWYFGDASGTYKTSSPYNTIPFPTNYKGQNGENLTDFGGDRVGNYTLYFEATNVCGEALKDDHKVAIWPLALCSQSLKGGDLEDIAGVKIFPNPSVNHWTVYLNNPNDQIQELNLYNSGGQRVRSISNQEHEAIIDIPGSDLAHGLYYLQIKTTTGRIIGKQLVKRQYDF